jgi:MFS family permease
VISTAATAPSGRALGGFDRLLLVPMMLGAILNPINSSIIAVALVPIARALGSPASQTAWLISGLYLATSIGQPLVGRLVDIFGPRRLYLVGTTLVGVGGLAGMLAPNLGVLIGARVVLGFGTCAGYPAAMSLIRSEAKRTGEDSPAGVLTVLAVATQTIAVIGPTLGGLLIGAGGWRATFAINVPLAVVCLVLGGRLLPRGTPLRGDEPPSRRLDYVGIVLFAVTLTALLLFLMNARLGLLWVLAISVVAAAAFALLQLRAKDPFIDVRVFAGNAPLLATYARTLVAYTVSYAFIYGFTPWLESARGLSPSVAGLILLATFGVGILVSATTGRRRAVRGKLVVGGLSQVVVCALLLLVHADAAIWFLVVIALILGLPQGLISLANQNALYHQADPERIGASSGLLRTFMYLGAIVSSAATGGFFGAHADTYGLHRLAAFMLCCAALFVILTLGDRSLSRVGRSEIDG